MICKAPNPLKLLLNMLLLVESGELHGGAPQDSSDRSCSTVEESLVEFCLRPILSYANGHQESSLLPLGEVRVFEELCKFYADFKNCVSSLDCVSIGPKAIDSSYGFMCNEGYSLFLSNVRCFEQVERNDTYNLCKSETAQHINEIDSSFLTSTLSPDFIDLCKTIRNYLRCSRAVIVETCSEKAWQLIARVTVQSLQITMPDCHLENLEQSVK